MVKDPATPQDDDVELDESSETAAEENHSPDPTPEPAVEVDSEQPVIPLEIGVLPLSNTVVFPYLVVPLQVNRPGSIALVDDALVEARIVGLFTQTESEDTESEFPKTFDIGTAANILKMLRYPDGSMMVLVQGIGRIRKIGPVATDKPYSVTQVEELPTIVPVGVEAEALSRNIQEQFKEIVSLVPSLSDELRIALENTEEPSKLADFIASNINLEVREKQEILGLADVLLRMRRLTELLGREVQVAKLGSKIQSKVETEMGKTQREYFLREQIRAIREELGESEGEDLRDLEERLAKAKLTKPAREGADREMTRLRRMNPSSAEYTVSRTYVEWILDVPWKKFSKDSLDLKKAVKVLDKDHYDLAKVKDRILEFMAVRKLTENNKSPILCFVGPPGVGKTSLGKSIARSMGRKFVRMSLGGMHDEAEIRGHRRTYIGSLPGRIVQGLKTAGTINPVMMLDEIDKVGSDFRGDPASALLEVLDPEQNDSFEDHYLAIPVDLSKVLFITTANVLQTIPQALRDRMEVIRIAGYTVQDKLAIAKEYLIPRVLKANGLTRRYLEIPDDTITRVSMEYTREAGVRNLERELSNIARKVARKVAEDKRKKQTVTPDRLEEFLGAPHFQNEVALRTATPGVATGLAWTQAGGDILFIEATHFPGKGNLKLTGQLGEVMVESAQAAFSYLKSKQKQLRIPVSFLKKNDIHIHIPAGAVPKDGPSAGVTMATALYSLMTGKPVRADLAMTGEISLRGLVLPVGGLKEKVLAAKLAGIDHVLVPDRNRKDIAEIPEGISEGMVFHYAKTLDDVLRLSLHKGSSKRTAKGSRPKAKSKRAGTSKDKPKRTAKRSRKKTTRRK